MNKKIVWVFCMMCFGGCTTLRWPAYPTVKNKGTSERNAVENSILFYRIGKRYQEMGRYREASIAYHRALILNTESIEARNALAVVQALQGDYPHAILAFKQAIALSPSSAELYNNLGNTYLLQNQLADAVHAFDKAHHLDSSNPLILRNLNRARRRIEPRNSAPDKLRQRPAHALLSYPSEKAWELIQQTPYEYTLQRTVVEANVVAHVFSTMRPSETLEIANGNGVHHFAWRIGQYLQKRGFKRIHLTNQKPYQVHLSTIYYQPGYQAEATRLGLMLFKRPRLIESRNIREAVKVKIVVGHDYTLSTFYATRRIAERIRDNH